MLSAEAETLLFESIAKLQGVNADASSALKQNSKFSMDTDAILGSFVNLSG